MFPNEYNVYLHSTPAPQLFAQSRRDFSHGCIRVEKPAELAAWALRNNPGWDLAKAQAAMQSGKDNVQVNLTKLRHCGRGGRRNRALLRRHLRA
jgi:murein L,D-transpeptidase YcbB/YkuD